MEVQGESAWPDLIPGKQYFASRVLPVRLADFIVFQNPKNVSEVFVKRIKAIQQQGYEVESTVSWGSSSKDFGLIPKQNVLGKLLFVG